MTLIIVLTTKIKSNIVLVQYIVQIILTFQTTQSLSKDLRFRFSNCENVGATNPSNLTQPHTYFYLIGFNFCFCKSGIVLENSKISFSANVNLVQSCTHWVIAPQSSTQLFMQIFNPPRLNATRRWFATLWMKTIKI